MSDYKRLIISDLHLGSAFSREEQLLELLKTIEFDELILAGDIIDFIKVPIFNDDKYNDLQERVKNSEKGILISA